MARSCGRSPREQTWEPRWLDKLCKQQRVVQPAVLLASLECSLVESAALLVPETPGRVDQVAWLLQHFPKLLFQLGEFFFLRRVLSIADKSLCEQYRLLLMETRRSVADR